MECTKRLKQQSLALSTSYIIGSHFGKLQRRRGVEVNKYKVLHGDKGWKEECFRKHFLERRTFSLTKCWNYKIKLNF